MRFRRLPGVSSLESLAVKEGDCEGEERGKGRSRSAAGPTLGNGRKRRGDGGEDEREARERKPGEGVREA